MKHSLVLLICSIIALSAQAQHPFQKALVQKVNHQKDYLLECLRLLDDADLEFKPTDRSMNTRDLVLHITSNMIWISKDYLEGGTFKAPYDRKDLNKEELIVYTTAALDYAKQSISFVHPHELKTRVDFFAGEKNILQLMELLDDHITHHKGQLTVYMQLVGKKAPRFVGW